MRRASILLAALVALVVLPSVALAASKSCQQMRERLVYGGGAASGLFVIDAESGKAVCARAASRQRSLASNTKLFTTSTALSRFGPEYRISTKLLSDGSVGFDGTLHGSLYLQGGGDPALGVPSFSDPYVRPGTNLLDLAAQLHAAGVRAVTGRLYADDPILHRLRGGPHSRYAPRPSTGRLPVGPSGHRSHRC